MQYKKNIIDWQKKIGVKIIIVTYITIFVRIY